jgi:hypothetical protein
MTVGSPLSSVATPWCDIQPVLMHLQLILQPLLGPQIALDVLSTSSRRPALLPERLQQVLMHLVLMVRDSVRGGGTVTVRAYDGLGDMARSDGRRTWTMIEIGQVTPGEGDDVAVDTQAVDVGQAARDLALIQQVVGDAGGRLVVERRTSVGPQYIVQLPSMAV